MGVLQTTVAEMVTVKEHQRMSCCSVSTLPTDSFASARIYDHAVRVVPRVSLLVVSSSALTDRILQIDPRTDSWRRTGTARSQLSRLVPAGYHLGEISLSPA